MITLYMHISTMMLCCVGIGFAISNKMLWRLVFYVLICIATIMSLHLKLIDARMKRGWTTYVDKELSVHFIDAPFMEGYENICASTISDSDVRVVCQPLGK